MFKEPFSFNGRIRRLEFALSTIIFYICNLALFEIDEVITPVENPVTIFFTSLGTSLPMLVSIYVIIAQGAKRCHDLGRSGWCQLIPFYFIWMYFVDGNPGKNEYGHNPKNDQTDDEVNSIGDKDSSPVNGR